MISRLEIDAPVSSRATPTRALTETSMAGPAMRSSLGDMVYSTILINDYLPCDRKTAVSTPTCRMKQTSTSKPNSRAAASASLYEP